MNQSREGLYLSAGFLLALLAKSPPLWPQQATWSCPSSPEGWFFEAEMCHRQRPVEGSLQAELLASSSACPAPPPWTGVSPALPTTMGCMVAPERYVHVLVPGTCVKVPVFGQRIFADVMKDLEMQSPWSPRTSVLKRETQRKEEEMPCEAESGRMQPHAKECLRPPDTGRDGRILAWSLERELELASPLI